MTAAKTATRTRVLICDELAPEALEILAQRGFDTEVRTGMSEEQLIEAARDAHALLVRSATRITARVIEAARALRVIGRAGVGVDNVDCDAATERGVVVMNTPDGNTTSAAELALAHLLSLARNLPRADRAARAGWKKQGLLGTEVTGKTLGLVGLGRIGRAVAERAHGLKLRVIAYDPYLGGRQSPLPFVEVVELEELLARSDFVSLHVPLSETTRNLLSRERLARMKRGARLINAARGGLVDERALAELLESGHLRGAALDVFAEEPPPKDHPLLARAEVVLSPHLGASSEEAQRQVAIDIAEAVADFFEQGVARTAVNAPALTAEALRELAPWLVLAEKIGALASQLHEEPLLALEVAFAGEIEGSDTALAVRSLLAGALSSVLSTPVNLVNAPRLAAERGIEVRTAHSAEKGFLASQMTVHARFERAATTIAGSVFGREPRITALDGVPLELSPRGSLLVTQHLDRPGVVGALGTLLGRHGVNIRRIELGPLAGADSGLAMGFLSLYGDPPPGALEELAALENVRWAKLVRL